ncbi:hypothetical protein NUU61_005307 [Penicillium alfredii]|uniref:Cyanovirin-N domain-containing protein n=1 Tax=Penicillium alfredii TaxID=1506179 RepID=A0A9W9F9B3_9EURO|nr:uncharacterized protein NUU61_005307 [Penicillium alfredii]KAJ5095951.1 hypothetical protein NUU61_005307 [Penicillium alfredii]
MQLGFSFVLLGLASSALADWHLDLFQDKDCTQGIQSKTGDEHKSASGDFDSSVQCVRAAIYDQNLGKLDIRCDSMGKNLGVGETFWLAASYGKCGWDWTSH